MVGWCWAIGTPTPGTPTPGNPGPPGTPTRPPGGPGVGPSCGGKYEGAGA